MELSGSYRTVPVILYGMAPHDSVLRRYSLEKATAVNFFNRSSIARDVVDSSLSFDPLLIRATRLAPERIR